MTALPAWAAVVFLCSAALLFDVGLWRHVWEGGLPHSWDGSGHYAAAKLYAEMIFPDTFGWLPQYAAGTPFPNYYPPLFYWLIGALSNWARLPFHAAFKIVVVAAAVATPAVIWHVGRRITRDRAPALLAGCAAFLLLFDKRAYEPLGIGYPGTFFTGLYTQSLGFCCLALWYGSFASAQKAVQWLRSALLLALVFLSNFFAASVAGMLWGGAIAYGALRAVRARSPAARRRLWKRVSWGAVTLGLALLLSGFWIFPMLAQRAFIISRPVPAANALMFNPLLLPWYIAGMVGCVLWLRRPTGAAAPFTATLAIGFGAIWFANRHILAPWFPLHAPRMLSMLNILVAVPTGIALFRAMQWLRRLLRPQNRFRGPGWVPVAAALLLLILYPAVQRPDYRLAFYSQANGDLRRIAPILEFATTHRDGRYLVEQPPFSAPGPSLDSRALASYLGMQGNEAVSYSFREAPISSMALLPLTMAMSEGRDPYGVTAALAEDAAFFQQDLKMHLEQASLYRVRYFVMVTNRAKARIASLPPGQYARYDFGVWSVFEMKSDLLPRVRVLREKPVLLLTSFTAKLTRQSDFNFLRIAQEQFAYPAGPPVAFHPRFRADRLPDPNMFSALVVEQYGYADIDNAFRSIQTFSRKKPVVLIESDDPLFSLLKTRISELGRASVAPRVAALTDRWITADRLLDYAGDSVRQTLRTVQAVLPELAENRSASGKAACRESRLPGLERIQCQTRAGPAPVVIDTSYHPNWRARDGRPVLMLSPTLIYTAIDDSAELRFRRSGFDLAALAISAATLFALFAAILRLRTPSKGTSGL